jgi:hypothetical protein
MLCVCVERHCRVLARAGTAAISTKTMSSEVVELCVFGLILVIIVAALT